MKKNIAMKLVAALRSGKYEQGNHRLNRDGRFCCLGVLCDIMGASWKKNNAVHKFGYVVKTSSISVTALPKWVQVQAGVAGPLGARKDGKSVVIGGRAYLNLADANDRGVSFADIADYIEQNYKQI